MQICHLPKLWLGVWVWHRNFSGGQNRRKSDFSYILWKNYRIRIRILTRNWQKLFLKTIPYINSETFRKFQAIFGTTSKSETQLSTRGSPKRFISEIYRRDLRLRILGLRSFFKYVEFCDFWQPSTQAPCANSNFDTIHLGIRNFKLSVGDLFRTFCPIFPWSHIFLWEIV